MALINDFLSLIYPRFCEACDGLLFKHESFICNGCLVSLPKSNFHHDTNNPIIQTLGGRMPLVSATSLYVFEKQGRVQKLLHALKYENQQALGGFLGELLYNDLKPQHFFEGIDLVVPVPLHPKRLETRGYNQSECFAKGICKHGKIDINTNTLVRKKETATQTKKRKYERWENVTNVFALNVPETFRNKHILLVDDVVTTGATIEAVWQSLKNIEGISVSVASIAFAIK